MSKDQGHAEQDLTLFSNKQLNPMYGFPKLRAFGAATMRSTNEARYIYIVVWYNVYLSIFSVRRPLLPHRRNI